MAQEHTYGENRTEPFWWGLFAAGGGLTAVAMPAHMLFQQLLGSLGLPVATSSYRGTRRLLANPLIRLYLFILTSLSFFHWAHRFRYYLEDFGLTGARHLIARLCYGSAVLGTLAAARGLRSLPDQEA
jgi:fumarate reductase subunit D